MKGCGEREEEHKRRPSPLLSHRADLLVRMALVTSFLPRSWRKKPGETGVDNLSSLMLLVLGMTHSGVQAHGDHSREHC